MSDNSTPTPAGEPQQVPPPPSAPAAHPPIVPTPPTEPYPDAAPTYPPASPTYPVMPPTAPSAPPAAPVAPPTYGAPAGQLPAYGAAAQQPPYGAPAQPGYYGSTVPTTQPAPGYPYGAQGYGAPRPNSGLAITSLICGIGGIVLFWLWAPVLASIAAVVTGHLALKQMKQNPTIGGRGMAIAGLITGYAGIGLLVAQIAFFVILLGAFSSTAILNS